MAIPVQITFRHMPPSDALRRDLEDKLQVLARRDAHVLAAHVSVEGPPQHHRKGNLFRAAVSVRLAHSDDFGAVREHEDAYVAVRDALQAARRQLDGRPGRRRDSLRRVS